MNRIYRLVWNRVRGCLVVASEIARARGKHGRAATTPSRWLLALPLGLAPMFALAASPATTAPPAVTAAPVRPISPAIVPVIPAPIISAAASPTGGQVTAGSGAIIQSGLTTTIDQHSQNLSLNWQSFNIGADSTVNFVQPNAQAIAVNRIADPNGSVILGRLNANGQVFLINPNGVLFGQGAQVNVGGLVASTLDVSDSELGRGTLHFTGDSQADVINQGAITANGGYVALVGAQVVNNGTIAANGGSVALGGGNAVTLSFDGNRLLGLQVDKSAMNALAENRQLIVADGGQVLMSAGAKDALLASTVNNTGVIQARTVENRAGRIVLLGGMAVGQTTVAGTLDASAPNGGNGGFVETSAAHVTVAPGVRITTVAANGHIGNWLIDPVDYTIAASGGDITGAQLSTSLGTSNVTIFSSAGTHGGTNGDINVNDTVAWAANTLTLNAQNNININTAMNGSGTASLALVYGQGAVAAGNTSTVNVRAPVNLPSGNNFSTTRGSDGTPVGYTVISSLGAAGSTTSTDLQGINGNLAGNYVLGANIDASATSSWNAGAGFAPFGDYTTPFTGSFDGLGHTINGLVINRPDTSNVGLFGYMGPGGTIRNVGLLGGSVRGYYSVGGLVGSNNRGTITQTYTTNEVSGYSYVGGLVGANTSQTTSHVYATGAVSGSGGSVGGLVGDNSIASPISDAYATGAVSGLDYVGGLVGSNSASSSISQAYATGAINGRNNVGGLVGDSSGSSISQAYATGTVTGSGDYIGGLVGYSASNTISQAYATGVVSGLNNVGGLVGINYFSPISKAYAIGAVSGLNGVGGLVGNNNNFSTISETYATGSVRGTSSVGGLVGMNDPLSQITFSYWDRYSTGQANGVGSGTAAGGAFAITSDPGQITATTDAFARNTYTYFDFTQGTGTWFMINGSTRPFLQSEYSTTINNAHQLQLVAMNLGASYTLGSNIDATATGLAARSIDPLRADMWISAGFAPLGDDTAQFTGSFDGLGHTITGLVIDRPATSYVGLFGAAGSTGTIRNVGLLGGYIAGHTGVGALVGYNVGSTISQAYATGKVSGLQAVGGLIGANSGEISQVYATGEVNADYDYVGGLVGYSVGGKVSQAYATGAVHGRNGVGGLAGYNEGGIYFQTYATGAVNGGDQGIGGLIGYNNGAISLAYATGAVSGTDLIGGLVGYSVDGTISQAYATGAVSGTNYVGGLVGMTNGANTITQTYATGAVSGSSDVGGLVGAATGSTIEQSYWNTQTTGQSLSDGVDESIFGLSSADMLKASSFVGWDLATAGGSNAAWRIYEGHTAPLLRAFMTLASGSAASAGKTYDGAAFGDYGIAISSVTPGFWLAGTTLDPSLVLGQAHSNAVNAGSYALDGAGLYSTQMGYDLAIAPGTLTIGRATLGVSLVGNLDKVYDGSTDATLTSGNYLLSGFVGHEGATIIQTTGNYNSKNVADADTVTATLTGNSFSTDYGTLLSNYVLPATVSSTGHITPLGITVAANASSKIYDATTAAAVSLGSSGALAGDSVNFSGTGSFADKNAGTGKTVTVNGIAASGADAGNYSFNTTATDTADISQLGVTVGAAGGSKVYDGTALGTVTLNGIGVLAGDTVVFTGNGMFDDKDVGTAKAVTVSGITASGADAGNYSYNTTASTTADVTQLGITVDATANDKVYDTTTHAVVALGSSGVLAGDVVTFDGTGNFDNKNAGIGKTVTVDNIAASGADAGNYSYSTNATDTADIALLDITVDASASDKVYDATTNAVIALGSSGALAGDTLTLAGSGHFSDKNVGAAKAVTVALDASGADAGNYRFHAAPGTTADITPATLVYQADPASFTSGEGWGSLGGTVAGLVGDDTLTGATDGTLAWQTPATATSPAGAYAIEGSGLFALNYVFVQAPGNATALHLSASDAPAPIAVPSLIGRIVAGLQQTDDSDETLAPYAPDVRIVNGGVRLP